MPPAAAPPVAPPPRTAVEIFVDADACPVKDEIFRVAGRLGLISHVVANTWMRLPEDPNIRRVVVGEGPDVADDWIAERVGPGCVVVTTDVPLADRCVKAGARVVTPTGRILDAGSIGMALATRDLLDDLRSAGAVTSGPRPCAAKDRQAFLQALDREVRRAAKILAQPVAPLTPAKGSVDVS
ncbi:YaiI/YqxD family protein [Siculibacillus lacustris]|uniref:UPF0178 protein EYW49_18080 n=2 Tax=Siculibacillus lacustris TaxID=1549641 RepID=A0A4Q9VHY7_9HYPH|nr:YaiI/YqxD family protein [Siculibacillus lacustris]TBW34532.1 YaiI/YqxD family protein [Siculibacillus lacustris]